MRERCDLVEVEADRQRSAEWKEVYTWHRFLGRQRVSPSVDSPLASSPSSQQHRHTSSFKLSTTNNVSTMFNNNMMLAQLLQDMQVRVQIGGGRLD